MVQRCCGTIRRFAFGRSPRGCDDAAAVAKIATEAPGAAETAAPEAQAPELALDGLTCRTVPCISPLSKATGSISVALLEEDPGEQGVEAEDSSSSSDTDQSGAGSPHSAATSQRSPQDVQDCSEGSDPSRCWRVRCLELLAENLSHNHQRHLTLGSFQKCWRQAMEADGHGHALPKQLRKIRAASAKLLDGLEERHGSAREPQTPATGRQAAEARPAPAPGTAPTTTRSDESPDVKSPRSPKSPKSPRSAKSPKSPKLVASSRRDCRRHAWPVEAWLWRIIRSRESPVRVFFESLGEILEIIAPLNSYSGRLILRNIMDSLISVSNTAPVALAYDELVNAVARAVIPMSSATSKEAHTDKDDASAGASLRHAANYAFDLSIDASSSRIENRLKLLSRPFEGLGLTSEAFLCVAFGRRPSEVRLHCYNIASQTERVASKVLLGLDGIWHTGIVAHGREYWYGGHVHKVKSGLTPFGTPIHRIVLGQTLFTKREIEADIQDKLLSRFTTEAYDVLTLNCNDFCDALAMILLGRHIPDNVGKQSERAMRSPLVRFLKPFARNSSSSASGSNSSKLIGATPAPVTMLVPVGGGGRYMWYNTAASRARPAREGRPLRVSLSAMGLATVEKPNVEGDGTTRNSSESEPADSSSSSGSSDEQVSQTESEDS